ncbi:dihydroxyacetone kinase family protein [Haematococcus lacustris]
MSGYVLDNVDGFVQAALDGLLLSCPHLVRLDGFPDIKVVFDATHKKDRVAVVSGGGSGHEPAHAGYVGEGMLAAAVAGEVFASPSADAVLAAIQSVTGPPGCLLVVKNYTGDRLHFGLAAERGKALGLAVEMVVVGEDVALPTPGLAGRRGLAATVLVHKVAGAVAASGASLAQVAAAAQAVADQACTLGVCSRVCSLPGRPPSDRLAPGLIEIGLGIHGEPGASQLPHMPAQALVEHMLAHMCDSPFCNVQEGEPLLLLVNNLGASTALEVALVARAAALCLQQRHKAQVVRVLQGPFMTSLDMAGFSLTLLRLAPAAAAAAAAGLAPSAGPAEPEAWLLQCLDRAVAAPGWPPQGGPARLLASCTVPSPLGRVSAEAGAQQGAPGPSSADLDTPQQQRLRDAVAAAATALVQAAGQLDQLDALAGDGDCGQTLRQAAQAVLADLQQAPHPTLSQPAVCMAAVAASVRKVGGTSGALYELGFTAAASALKAATAPGTSPGLPQWAAALQQGTAAVAKYGGAGAGCRTMLDALLPASQALLQAAEQGVEWRQAALDAAAAAERGAAATQGMQAAAGRASYVPAAALAAGPDPGALAVQLWLAAAAQALQ